MLEQERKVPVSVITGFLGSGKTTLLKHLVHHPASSDMAVIVNELGEIGLDHHLLEVAEGDVVVMSSGCLCCTVRNDLAETLSSLADRRQAGELSRFRRVVIETTGLADPAPILHTLMQDALVTRSYGLDTVLTTVDAVFGEGQLDRHDESMKQAAVADRLLLTKTDLGSPDAIDRLTHRLQVLNPAAAILRVTRGEVEPAALFGDGLYELAAKTADVRRWLRVEAYTEAAQDEHSHAHSGPEVAVHRHSRAIEAHCLVFDRPLDWRFFSPNLASLISRHAEKLLRVKGLLNVAGEPAPIVVHGVQHQFQRLRLPKWPDEDRRSRLVLITSNLSREFLARWLQDETLS